MRPCMATSEPGRAKGCQWINSARPKAFTENISTSSASDEKWHFSNYLCQPPTEPVEFLFSLVLLLMCEFSTHPLVLLVKTFTSILSKCGPFRYFSRLVL